MRAGRNIGGRQRGITPLTDRYSDSDDRDDDKEIGEEDIGVDAEECSTDGDMEEGQRKGGL